MENDLGNSNVSFCKTPPIDQTLNFENLEKRLDSVLTENLVIEFHLDKFVDIPETVFRIFTDLMNNESRREKYRDFLKQSFKLREYWKYIGLENIKTRFEVLVLEYIAQRYLDDVVDGDIKGALVPKDTIQYTKLRIKNSQTEKFNLSDPVDAMTILLFKKAKELKIKESVKKRHIMIQESMLFDAKRITKFQKTGEYEIFNKKEIEKHFFKLDIEGTVGGSLSLFGYKDSQRNLDKLQYLGAASRVLYNVRDFFEDLEAGLCNIPTEDCKRLGITKNILEEAKSCGKFKTAPEPIRRWIFEQIQRGKILLKNHEKFIHIRFFSQQWSQKTWWGNLIKLFDESILKYKILRKLYLDEIYETFEKIEPEVQ